MRKIRKEVSDLLKFGIAPDAWDSAFALLDREGVITEKKIIQILLILLKREEARENGQGGSL